jgi:hypothetical protein
MGRFRNLLDRLVIGHLKPLYCRVVGGEDWIVDEADSGRIGTEHDYDLWWRHAMDCRRLGHIFDGSEIGYGIGEHHIDLWCSRCFHHRRKMPLIEVWWYPTLTKALRSMIDEDPEEWEGFIPLPDGPTVFENEE